MAKILANGANDKLKRKLYGRSWLVAYRLGISPGSLSQWLRYELTPERRQKIETALADVIREETE